MFKDLDDTLLLQIVVGLSAVHIPLIVFQLLHSLVLKNLLPSFLLELLSNYAEFYKCACIIDIRSAIDVRDRASSMRVIS